MANALRTSARTDDTEQPATPAGDFEPRGLILWGIAIALGAVALAWGLILARQALLLVYLSALLAIGLSPLVRLVERRTPVPLPRWVAVMLVYAGTVGVGLVISVLVVPVLVGQAQEFAAGLPALIERGQRWLMEHGMLRRHLTVQEVMQQTPGGTDAVGAVLVTMWGVLGGVFGVLVILVLGFYFLIETDALFGTFIRLFPRASRPRVRAAAGQITEKVSAWLSGQVMLGAVIGGTAAIALGLMGVPYFYVLAFIAGVGEMIPYLGPLLSAVPAVAIASTVSWQLALAVALFFFLQQQLENYLLVPRMMGGQVGLSSATIIVALLIGGSIFGILGAVLAVPTAAILHVLFQELVPAGEESGGAR